MQSGPSDRTRMVVRHEMVMALIDNNLRQLRCDNRRRGVEFERQLTVRAAALPGAPPQLQTAVAECDRRLAEIDEEGRRLGAARDWLTATLAAFDADADGSDAKEDLDG